VVDSFGTIGKSCRGTGGDRRW